MTVNASVHTVVVQTADHQRLAEFFGRGLELGEAQATGPDHLGFQLPHCYLGFDRVSRPAEPTGVVSLWFAVRDLQATYERFLDLGARVKYPPTKKDWGAELAALYDPDGNLFGLTAIPGVAES